MTRPDPNSAFYRPQQLAVLLNISDREVQRLRDSGELRYTRLGSKVMIPRAEYERLCDRLNAEAGLAPVRVLPSRGRPRKATGQC